MHSAHTRTGWRLKPYGKPKGEHVLHVDVSRISGTPFQLSDAISGTAGRAGGTVTRERYAVVVFEQEAPLRGGQGVRVTRLNVEPSKLSDVEDAVAWYGDTVVPRLADASGFCAALLFADWDSGRLISETVWQDPHALAASRSVAMAAEAAAMEALTGVIGASGEYELASSSARRA
jgi:hypothetical protein